MTDKENCEETKQSEVDAEPKSLTLTFEGHVKMGDVRMTNQDFQTVYGRGKLGTTEF
jgi:hypothetical protein